MSNTNNDVLYFFDVNTVANAGGNLGGVDDAADWELSYGTSHATPAMRTIDRAVKCGLRLATSATFLRTLKNTLQKQDARDFDALDREGAEDTADTFRALVKSTDGPVVSDSTVLRYVPEAKAAVSYYVRGVERIDHEDATIIAGCLAAMAQANAAAVVLVTDDSGLLNCARELAHKSIVVQSTASFLRQRSFASAM